MEEIASLVRMFHAVFDASESDERGPAIDVLKIIITGVDGGKLIKHFDEAGTCFMKQEEVAAAH